MAQTMTRIEGEARVIASDNPFVLPGGDNGAIAGEVVVRPDVRWTLGPGTTARLNGALAFRQYSRRYGDFLTARAEAAVSHRDSEYLTVESNAVYSRDLPADALTEAIDFAIDSRSVRERLAWRGSLAWSPDARTTLTGAIGWERLRYPRSTWLAPANAWHLDVSGMRRISPRTWVGLRGSATRTDILGVARLDAHSVYATVTHRIGEVLDGNLDVGVEWSGYDRPGNSRARIAGRASLCYRPDPLDLCLTASRQSEVSGFGGLQQELAAGITVRRRVGTRGRINALAEYRRADLGLLDTSTSARRFGVGYRHRLTERLSLTGEVDHLARNFMLTGRNQAVVARLSLTFGREN